MMEQGHTHESNHFCLIYNETWELDLFLIQFLKTGLENEDCFIFIADDDRAANLQRKIRESGLSPEELLRKGYLKLITRSDWRFLGEIDFRNKIDQILRLTRESINAGFASTRFVVEMSWAADPAMSPQTLQEWEDALNDIFTIDYPGRIICLYSQRNLPPMHLNHAFKTHRELIIDNIAHKNLFFNAPLVFDSISERNVSDWLISQVKGGVSKHSVIGQKSFNHSNIPWGTHICNFFKTKEDLCEILIPYFIAGLRNNEKCIWVASDILNTAEAEASLEKYYSPFHEAKSKGQIEIIDAAGWYLNNGDLRPKEEILSMWGDKEKEALKNGFKGLRVHGDTHWLSRMEWDRFESYESEVSDKIHNHKIIALCSYCLDTCTPSDIVDVVNRHPYSFIKKDGKLMIIESDEHKRAESLLMEGYRELEERVQQRTSELLKNLEEKEILLKEIHHRVKNNMQVISSLIRLQSSYLQDDKSRQALEECQNRIKSMALVHEALYLSKDFSSLDLRTYIKELTKEFFSTFNLDEDQIKIEVDIDDISLDMDRSIACGLIINELVTNSLKYAFPGDNPVTIRISFSANDSTAQLSISDDGVGYPKAFDLEKSETLGTKLIRTLIDQLEGNYIIRNGSGITFEITFPLRRQHYE